MSLFHSIRGKMLAVVTLTAFFALLVSSLAIFIYEINSFRTSRINDMAGQVDLLAYSTAPALQFLDENMARENLDLLRIQPDVSMAAIYDAEGRLFASYVRAGETLEVPPAARPQGVTIVGGSIEVVQPILLDNNRVGTAYLRASYPLGERIVSFLLIQLGVAAGALILAVALTIWLQRRVTQPVLSIAEVAREIVDHKDFTKRAEKTSDDEVGILVDAFNDMLREIDARTTVLETTNRELEHEIAERKRARVEILYLNGQLERRIDELNERDRNKDDFLATLAHELRNPLAPIRTGLEVLRRADDRTREKIYAILERQTHHLIRLVDDLMEVSRISRGKITLKTEMVVLEDVIQVAVDATRELMQQKQHQLEVQLPGAPVVFRGDPVRLTQVFLNLLSNAAHYTQDGGQIALTATCHDDLLEVVVRDNGIGIAPDMLEKVFGAFIQLDNPLRRMRGGLGIGLTLARALVMMHDGTIRAESDGPGKGARFIVQLPLRQMEGPDAPAQGNADNPAAVKRRILVVDDNEDAAQVLAMQLRLSGHELQVANAGADALQIGAEFLPDTILMDIGMPGMNGFEAAQRVRQQDWGKHVLLVAVTGWGQPEDKRQSRAAGFDYHLVKPVKATDIESLLQFRPRHGPLPEDSEDSV